MKYASGRGGGGQTVGGYLSLLLASGFLGAWGRSDVANFRSFFFHVPTWCDLESEGAANHFNKQSYVTIFH